MSASYVFVYFFAFADLCCKCSFTRMLWFFEYYEACTLWIKDFVVTNTLREVWENTFHLCLFIWQFLMVYSVRTLRSSRSSVYTHGLCLLWFALQIALLDSPTALSMEEKLQQNEARVSDTITWFFFFFNRKFHYFILFIYFLSFTILSGYFFSIGLARKFVQVCPQDVKGKPKQTFWPAQDLLSDIQFLSS